MIVMLMNFKSNYMYCSVHVFFSFVFFSLIFVLTYSLNRMSRRGRQIVKGFLAVAGKSLASRSCDEDTLFQGSASTSSRRAELLRHVRDLPELRGKTLAVQRTDVNDLTYLSYLPKFHL